MPWGQKDALGTAGLTRVRVVPWAFGGALLWSTPSLLKATLCWEKPSPTPNPGLEHSSGLTF